MEADIQTAFDADRLNEKRFTIQEDEEMTKAIPIIKDEELAKAAGEKKLNRHPSKRIKQRKTAKKKVAVGIAHDMHRFHHGWNSRCHCFPIAFYA